MKLNLRRLKYLLFFLLPLAGCDNGNEDIAIEAPGVVRLCISMENWEQDSLSGAVLSIEGISLDGPGGVRPLNEFDGPVSYNLLEYQNDPYIVLTEQVSSGSYTGYELEMNILKSGAAGKEHKVAICHIPPGNPQKAKTLKISACAVPAHTKNHDDYLGFCTGNESDRNKGYSYVQYNNGKIVMLFADRRVFAGQADFEIFEGDTTDIAMTFNVEESITPESRAEDTDHKNGRKSGHGHDGDDDDGDGHHRHDDDHDHHGDHDDHEDKDHDCDDGDCNEEECQAYRFVPVMTIEVLTREGGIDGIYEGSMNTRMQYYVYLYASGTYQPSEADRNNPFPNSMAAREIDSEGKFAFGEIPTGFYDIIVAVYLRDRFRDILIIENDVEVKPNSTATVHIQN